MFNNNSSWPGGESGGLSGIMNTGQSWFSQNQPDQAQRQHKYDLYHQKQHRRLKKTAPKHSNTIPEKTVYQELPQQKSERDNVPVMHQSFPETSTQRVDWALCAAHRVARIRGIATNETGSKPSDSASNLAKIIFEPPQREWKRPDSRRKLYEHLTLESLLIAAYRPEKFASHISAIAAQHKTLKTAVLQCVAQIDLCETYLLENAARDRDLLIKNMLFHADNAKDSCALTFDLQKLFEKYCDQFALSEWSPKMQQSLIEPDLFGRAVSQLVHKVLQSDSLRIFYEKNCKDKTTITLQLSWADAVENITKKHTTKRADNSSDDLVEKLNKKTTDLDSKKSVIQDPLRKHKSLKLGSLFDSQEDETNETFFKPTENKKSENVETNEQNEQDSTVYF